MNFRKQAWLAGALAVLLAACAPRTPTPAPTATPIPAVLPTPRAVAAYAERVIAEIDARTHPLSTPTMLGNYPDEIVYLGGFIWTRATNGHVLQVDPASNAIVNAIQVDKSTDANNYCQGLGTDGEHLWSCSARGDLDNRTIDVVRIDPAAPEVIATFEVGKVWDQFHLPFVHERIWVLVGDGSQLVGINVQTNQAEAAIALGSRCFQLAAAGERLVATCRLDNRVILIDPETKAVAAETTVPSPDVLAAAPNGIWVFQQPNTITRLDPATLAPVVSFAGIIADYGLHASETSVWVRAANGSLYNIDPATNALVELIRLDERLAGGGNVLVAAGSLWTTVNETTFLVRLSLK
jgi:hypothetical protein